MFVDCAPGLWFVNTLTFNIEDKPPAVMITIGCLHYATKTALFT